jgi:hypothetical protein
VADGALGFCRPSKSVGQDLRPMLLLGSHRGAETRTSRGVQGAL